MNELRELYQELIIDHGRHPRNFGKLNTANHVHEGYNPLCGDRLTVYLQEKNGKIENARFEGSGCAISMASASLMIEKIMGQTFAEINELFSEFRKLVTEKNYSFDEKKLGKLVALAGVTEFPMRVKCATLCWHTVIAAMKNSQELVSTE